jgi:hypothetical protein
MNVRELEQKIECALESLGRSSLQDSCSFLAPRGFKPKVQLSILPRNQGDKIRKKRCTASIESFDPRTDCFLITFEPCGEEFADALPETKEQPAGPDNDVSEAIPDLSPGWIETVVTALDRAEASQHPFIGLKFFRDRLLPQTGEPWAAEDRNRQSALRQLIGTGVIETGKVPNPQNAEFPVTTVKLNRGHALVKEILSRAPRRPAAEFHPVPQRGELVSRLIVKDRR